MPYLVDGNNVMGQSPGWHRDRAGARRRLLAEVAEFVAATKARVTVVFDGAPDEYAPDGSSFRGVRVYYPARGMDADTLIIRLVESAVDRRGIVVVTSDRQLAAQCRGAGSRHMRSGDFRKLMASSADSPSESHDPGATESPVDGTVDDWIEYFGIDPDSDR
jgi:predicted RNA-binding protein with PIN domain